MPVARGEQQRRQVPGQRQAQGSSVRRDDDHAHGREQRLDPLVHQHPLDHAQHVGHRQAGHHQRAPRDPQRDAERGLVRAVAADVADHHVDGAVGELDRVVEVAAEQGAVAARAVAGGQVEVRVAQQRDGQQAAFEPRVLAGEQLLLQELLLDLLGALAFAGEAQRLDQQRAVHLVLDEVVLRAGGDRGDAGRLVVLPGQDDHRDAGGVLAEPGQPAEAHGVGQLQVEHDAVGGERAGQRGAQRFDAFERERHGTCPPASPRPAARRRRRPRSAARAGGYRGPTLSRARRSPASPRSAALASTFLTITLAAPAAAAYARGTGPTG